MNDDRKGFTLLELVVVVGIVGVLLAIIVPELTTARQLGRAALCRSRQRQIGDAFAAVLAEPKPGEKAMAYPHPRAWPGIPYTHAPYERIFLCPEDDPGDWDVISGLEYVSGYSPHPKYPFVDGYRGPAGIVVTRGRRGTDAYGPYWEFVHEEAYEYPYGCEFWDQRSWYPSGPNYSDNDGVFRIYDNYPGRGRLLRLHEYTCTVDNAATLFGEPLFPPDSSLLNKKGAERVLAALYTSYGINPNCHAHRVAPDTVVLMDLDHTKDEQDFIADPTAASLIRRLNRAARHLNKINVLFGDGSVRSLYPAQLYPQANLDIWSP